MPIAADIPFSPISKETSFKPFATGFPSKESTPVAPELESKRGSEERGDDRETWPSFVSSVEASNFFQSCSSSALASCSN